MPPPRTYDGDVAALVRALAPRTVTRTGGWPTCPPMRCDLRSVGRGGRDDHRCQGPSGYVMPRFDGVTVGGLVAAAAGRTARETRHQFERPFVLDSGATRVRFELAPTPRHTAVEETVAALRRRDCWLNPGSGRPQTRIAPNGRRPRPGRESVSRRATACRRSWQANGGRSRGSAARVSWPRRQASGRKGVAPLPMSRWA